jgi:hypothetical protein
MPVYLPADCPTWALDVADDASGRVVHELDANLSNTTTGSWEAHVVRLSLPPRRSIHALLRTGAAEDTSDLDKLDGDPARPISDEPGAEKFDIDAHFAESIFATMRCT